MIWEKTQELLKESIPGALYALWIEPLQFLEVRNETVYLLSPDRYFSAYINRNFLETITTALAESSGTQQKVVLCEQETKPAAFQSNESRQLRLPTVPRNNSVIRSLHPRYTFDEYMVGESNILAQSACRSMSFLDDSIGPCLYINSATGLGKSHLTHAVAHSVTAQSPMTRLHYVTAQQFSLEMVRHIQAGTMNAFKKKYHEDCDTLLVEDVHSLRGKKKTQEELNEIFDALIKSGRRVICTSKKPPRELDGIDEEFRSRMTSGLVTAIQAPDIATRQRIIAKKATQHKLELNEEHRDYLAQHIRGDVRQIESAIVAIGAKSRLLEKHIDQNMIEEIVAQIVGIDKTLTVTTICEMIATQFQVSLQEMQSKSRKRKLAFPRQIAMYLCRKHTEDSLADIGRIFNRDHSTVLHAIKKVNELTVRDTSVNAQLALLSNKIKGL